MLGLLGIIGVITVAVLTAVFAAGCASSTTPSADGDPDIHGGDDAEDGDWYDLPDADTIGDGDIDGGDVEMERDVEGDIGDGDIIDDDVDSDADIDGDVDDDVEPDIDVDGGDVETDFDGDIDDVDGDVEPDADTDEAPPIPGYNPTSYNLGGVFRDLDVIAPGKIRAFGGTPLRLLECDINGINDVTCHDVVDMPSDAGLAVNYEYRGEGVKSIAVAATPMENPIDVMFIDESSNLVEPHYKIEDVPMPGFSYTPTRPGGIAFHHSSVLDSDRIFISTANWYESEDRFVRSTLLLFGESSTETKPVESVGFSSGVNVRALDTVQLIDAEEEGGYSTRLIALNAGSLDPYDDRHAAIDLMDPNPAELHVAQSIDLGAIELFSLSEIKFNLHKGAIYVVQRTPDRRFMRIDLESSVKDSIPIDAGLISNLVDMSVDGGKIYMAEGGSLGVGSIVVVDEEIDGSDIQLTLEKSYNLSASPVSMVVTGGIVAIAGDDGYLHLVDTTEVEWNAL